MSNQPAILYVEDDAMSRAVMEIILIHQMGFSNIAIFEDSTDFTTRLTQLTFKPDIVDHEVVLWDTHTALTNAFLNSSLTARHIPSL